MPKRTHHIPCWSLNTRSLRWNWVVALTSQIPDNQSTLRSKCPESLLLGNLSYEGPPKPLRLSCPASSSCGANRSNQGATGVYLVFCVLFPKVGCTFLLFRFVEKLPLLVQNRILHSHSCCSCNKNSLLVSFPIFFPQNFRHVPLVLNEFQRPWAILNDICREQPCPKEGPNCLCFTKSYMSRSCAEILILPWLLEGTDFTSTSQRNKVTFSVHRWPAFLDDVKVTNTPRKCHCSAQKAWTRTRVFGRRTDEISRLHDEICIWVNKGKN